MSTDIIRKKREPISADGKCIESLYGAGADPQAQMAEKTSSYWMIRRYVRDYAIAYTHPSVHLQGVFLRITDNVACVPIEHFEREYGTSTYTIKKLIKLYSNIVGFSL